MNAPHDPSPELAALLRVKRHEQPPAEYFEKFVHAFRDRQRAELLRVSSWQLFVDRVDAYTQPWRAAMQPLCALRQPRWSVPLGAAAALALLALLARPGPDAALASRPTPPPDAGAAVAGVHPVGVLPLPASTRTPATSPWVVPVSTRTPSPSAAPSNGLRRTPGDALVPVLPSSQDGSPSQADHGKVIILVR